MATEKTESRSIYKGEWVGDTYHMKYDDGQTETFMMQRAVVKIHDDAKRYGFTVKLNRFHAVSATDFPSLKLRMEEGRRRMREWRDHIYAGNETWDLAKKASAPRITRDDAVEAINRAYPGKGAQVFDAKLAELGKGKTPELGMLETVKFWMQTKQVAAAWATIQAERKAAAAASFGDADDEIARLMAGEPAPEPAPF